MAAIREEELKREDEAVDDLKKLTYRTESTLESVEAARKAEEVREGGTEIVRLFYFFLSAKGFFEDEGVPARSRGRVAEQALRLIVLELSDVSKAERCSTLVCLTA